MVAVDWPAREHHELTGVELMLFDPRRFYAVRTAVEILVAVRDLFPHAIDVANVSGLDRDWGTDTIRIACRSKQRGDSRAVVRLGRAV